MASCSMQCKVCGKTKPLNSEVCSLCDLKISPNSHQVAKSSPFSLWFIYVGIVIIFGPALIFLFTASLPSFFSQDTIMVLGYFSAFGAFVYFPIGVIVLVVGIVLRDREINNTQSRTNNVK